MTKDLFALIIENLSKFITEIYIPCVFQIIKNIK